MRSPMYRRDPTGRTSERGRLSQRCAAAPCWGIFGGHRRGLESTTEGADESIPLAESLLLASASGINDRIPSKQNVEGVELDAGRRGSVFQDRVSESGEQAGLRAGLACGDVVAPADGGSVAELG